MPNSNSRFKKVIFKEHMPISRTSASRSLVVVVEVRGSPEKDPKEVEIINFADSIVRPQIMNEGWEGVEKSVQHMEYNELPVLGDSAKEEGDFIGWIVRPPR
jgi:hypothetical protein